ncbi:unnamed protein product [Rotaria socialis]|uniref:MAM domain-containing protein n=1 Tax=Rotaria socialis TaxID=392032 RepID=A0A820L9G4_9BILA|nr:unnamed protein product [Rotaria socialis]
MRELLCVVFVVLNYISCIHAKTVYDCNFDDATSADNCFTSTINVAANIGNPNAIAPAGPLSDVTSSLKPTDSGEACKLPYRVGSFSWDMYFCNRGYCPTENNSNSTCKPGKFSSLSLNNNIKNSFQLKTESGGIDSVDQQCLIYYYYMSSMAGTKIITVTKEETSGTKTTIDSVTSSPFNGWIQRKILFKAETRGYKLYFEAQRTSGFQTPTVGFDEISIHEGSCDDQQVTSDPTAVTSVPIQTTTTTTPTGTATTTTLAGMTTATTPTGTTTTTTKIPEAVQTSVTETTTAALTSLIEITALNTTEDLVTTAVTILEATTEDGADSDDSSNTLTIILATVIPVVSIVLISTIIWLKKSSLKSFFAGNLHQSYPNNPNPLLNTTIEMNRVAPI